LSKATISVAIVFITIPKVSITCGSPGPRVATQVTCE
jgi:hypothetical protein